MDDFCNKHKLLDHFSRNYRVLLVFGSSRTFALWRITKRIGALNTIFHLWTGLQTITCFNQQLTGRYYVYLNPQILAGNWTAENSHLTVPPHVWLTVPTGPKRKQTKVNMSFSAPKGVIEENDTVILYLTATNRHAIEVTREIKNKNGEKM